MKEKGEQALIPTLLDDNEWQCMHLIQQKMK